MRQAELAEKREEDARDKWFNQARPMIGVKRTWREKWLAREENGTDSDDGQVGHDREEADGVKTLEGGRDQANMGALDVNMVFIIPSEFRAIEVPNVVELVVGVEWAVFERPVKPGEHMKLLYINGHIDGTPVGHMMVDGGASVNIMSLTLFEKLGCQESDLKRTNMSLSGFSGELAEAKGIVSKELSIRSKTMPTSFFVVDVKGQYNVLLGWDWIHANGCVPSTLHQCLMQCVDDHVEVVEADEAACVAMAEAWVDVQEGHMGCLTGRDLTDYNYISVSKDGFIPISIRPTTSSTWLADDKL
jgi:hypothetical protein